MKARVTFWNNLPDTTGTEVELEWSELFDKLSRCPKFQGDKVHPGWSAATFEPCERNKDNVKLIYALVLDYDGTSSIEDARDVWTGCFGFLHTTRKHTEQAHRFRVVLPLARPVTLAEYETLWPELDKLSGGKLDGQAKDGSRFWFMPGVMPGNPFSCKRLVGEPIDPTPLLRAANVTAETMRQERALLAQTATQTRSQHQAATPLARASAYLSKVPGAVSGQGGHDQTWSAALSMICGFDLSERDGFNLLWNEYNPRCVPPWSEKEIWHKVKQAANRSKLGRGYLLNEEREYRPSYEPYDFGPTEYDGMREPGDDSDEIDPEPEPLSEPQPEQSKPEPTKPTLEAYGVVTLRALCEEVYEAAKNRTKVVGYPTGHAELDFAIGKYRPEMVTLLGAGTSFGKTSFSIMSAIACVNEDYPVLILGGEDNRLMYGRRVVASRSGVGALALRDNNLTDEDIARIRVVAENAPGLPFFASVIGKPAEAVALLVRKVVKDYGIKLVILDYVQRFRTERRLQDRRNEVTYVAQTVSDAIKESGAAGLVLSQLKRIEGREPTMDDLKESGDLENMAEHVLLGHKFPDPDAQYSGEMKRVLIVAKNKDGPVGGDPIELEFNENTASFVPNEAPTMDNAEQF